MVHRLLALDGRLDHDLEVLGELALPHELGQGAGAQSGVFGLFGGTDHRIDRTYPVG